LEPYKKRERKYSLLANEEKSQLGCVKGTGISMNKTNYTFAEAA